MAKKKPASAPLSVEALTHEGDKRRNIPTAEMQPVVETAQQGPVRVEYARRNRDLDPQLVWRGKDEQDWSDLVVHAPPLYIQEKVHPKVLIDDLLRQSAQSQSTNHKPPAPRQLDLFADFNGIPEGADKTDFYQHDQNWSNRMILGDSLQVMASLAEREGLRGKVQCIYFDPPYGIKFNSNFQWSTTSRDVKDGNAAHITREPEQVKAFRDTWRDGIHSYLTYLRDRLTVARDLLTDSGSIFVQIGDENVHRVRDTLDEVFGEQNFCSQILFRTTGGQSNSLLASSFDILLWYAKSRENVKYRAPLVEKPQGAEGSGQYVLLEDTYGTQPPFSMSKEQKEGDEDLPVGFRVLAHDTLYSSGAPSDPKEQEYVYRGNVVRCPENNHWKPGGRGRGMKRLERANRFLLLGKTLRYKRYWHDFGARDIENTWLDTGRSGFAEKKRYVVETSPRVVQRCILMTSDPGDLVLDPTCGSGTTAYVSEYWGRRWITIDTSRVALALARARVMAGRYYYYFLADSKEGQLKEAEVTNSPPSTQPVRGSVRQGFVYERVPHITLRSIANNAEVDVIWERWQETLEPLRTKLNAALKQRWEEWEIPREADEGWPAAATKLHADWWKARIARQKEIDASIAAKAEFEFLYDKPYEDRKRVRVAGPFTVESLSPHRVLGVDENDDLIDPLAAPGRKSGDAESFVTMVLDNLRTAGVQQAHKEDRITFTSLAPWPGGMICAEGRFEASDSWLVPGGSSQATSHNSPTTSRRAAIFIGSEFGTVQRQDLVLAAREAGDAGFDVVISCAFNYEAHATEFNKLGRVPVLKARMNADLHMSDELKNTGKGNLFVIFGEPDIEVTCGLWLVTRDGRLVTNYECAQELSGLEGLDEINRMGRTDLSHFQRLPARRAVRTDESAAAGGRVGSVEHRRGSGAKRDGGVPAEPERGKRVAGRGGDADHSGQAAENDSTAGGGSAPSGSGRHQPNAGRAQAIAALGSLKESDFPLTLTTNHQTQITVRGVDVFHPNTGEVRSDGADGIACWFIDTDYNEESFFVRHAYFLGASDPYKSLKTTLKAEINAEAWESLRSDTSRPFDKPRSGRIAVKVINHLGDEVMKVFKV
jgi:adenine-specific DNA-methyltransferase